MSFVWSYWYIVMIFLVVAIAAAIVIFVMMDKKDRVLIDEFIKSAEQPVAPVEEKKVAEKVEEKSAQKVCEHCGAVNPTDAIKCSACNAYLK